jgi:hypothetical protein
MPYEIKSGMEEPMQKEKNVNIDIVKIQMVRDGSIEYGKKAISKPQELAELGLKFLKNLKRSKNQINLGALQGPPF